MKLSLHRTIRRHAGALIMLAAGLAGYSSIAFAQNSAKTSAPKHPAKKTSTSKTSAAPVWPVPNVPDALPGSILPAKRIVAFYGNPLSKRMGVLGELPPDDMLARLDREVAAWNAADPSTPVQPALHLIAVVAQGAPGTAAK